MQVLGSAGTLLGSILLLCSCAGTCLFAKDTSSTLSNISAVQGIVHKGRIIKSIKFWGLLWTTRSVSTELKSSISRTVYYAFFESHFWYALAFWVTFFETQFESIFKLQKSAFRYSLGLNCRARCQHLFKRFKIITLPSVYIFELITFIRKHLWIIQTNHFVTSHRVMQSMIFMCPITHTKLIKRSFFYNAKSAIGNQVQSSGILHGFEIVCARAPYKQLFIDI